MKACLELNLARDVKGKKRGFCRYISSKRKTGENVGSLLNRTGDLVTEDTEKTNVLSALFSLSLLAKPTFRDLRSLRHMKTS